MSSKAIPAETPLLSASNLLSTALSTLKSSPDAPPSAEALKSLDLSLKILTSLDPYMEEHSNAPPPGFQELSDATVNEDWDGLYEQGKISIKLGPQFSAGPYEGMFVAQVAKSIKAKRVLEIGMFTGTTTLCVAHALPRNGGQIVALEVVDYLETFVTPHFEKAGVKDRIDVMTGRADDALDQLQKEIQSGKAEPFDLIFIDADKGGYKTYWKKILEGGLLRKGGTMLIDNTLYSECSSARGAQWHRMLFTDSISLSPALHRGHTPRRLFHSRRDSISCPRNRPRQCRCSSRVQ